MNAAHNAKMQSLSNKVNGSKAKNQSPLGATSAQPKTSNILLSKLDNWNAKKDKLREQVLTDEINQLEQKIKREHEELLKQQELKKQEEIKQSEEAKKKEETKQEVKVEEAKKLIVPPPKIVIPSATHKPLFGDQNGGKVVVEEVPES